MGGGEFLPSSWGSSWHSTASAVLRPLGRLWEKATPAGRGDLCVGVLSPRVTVSPRAHLPLCVSHPLPLCARPFASMHLPSSPPHVLIPSCPPLPDPPPSAHRWPARRSGCGCRLPAPPSTPDQLPRGWGATRGRGSVRGGVRGGLWVPSPPPGPSDSAAQRLWVERGAQWATGSALAVLEGGCGGVLPPRSGAGTPAAASGVSPWGWRWEEESRGDGHSGTRRCPRCPPGARGSHRGGASTAQHSQQQLEQQQRVNTPQHRQALQHRPQHRRRLLVLPLSLRWVCGGGMGWEGGGRSGLCHSPCRPSRCHGGYLRGARGAAAHPRRASPPPTPPGRRAERGTAPGSAAAPRPQPGRTGR